MGQKRMLTDVRYVNTGDEKLEKYLSIKVISENKKQRKLDPRILIRSKLLLLIDGLLFYMFFVLQSTVRKKIRFRKNNYLETKFLSTGKNVHNMEHKVEICSIFFKCFS